MNAARKRAALLPHQGNNTQKCKKSTLTSVARQNIWRLSVVFLLQRWNRIELRTSSEAVDNNHFFFSSPLWFFPPSRSTVCTSQHKLGTVGSLTSLTLFCIRAAAATGNKSSQSEKARVESPSIGPDVEKGALEYLTAKAEPLLSSLPPCFCLAATSQISANRIRLGSDCLNTQKTCRGL